MVARIRAAGKHRGMAASYYAAALASKRADRAVVGRAGEKPLRRNAWLLFSLTLRLFDHTFEGIGIEGPDYVENRQWVSQDFLSAYGCSTRRRRRPFAVVHMSPS